MTTVDIPTPPQVSFINSLLTSRAVPAYLLDAAKIVKTKAEASMLIDSLKRLPYAPRAAAPSEYLTLLKAAEVSKYAVPTRYLHAALPEYMRNIPGDLLFLEVKNIGHGKRVFKRLVGAPGGFSRYSIPSRDAVALLKFIAGRHVEFAQLFGQHYSCCGRCAAELTDQVSRESGFGPECRKVFGL